MTLSEIETILPELALRHPDLNEQLLTTLLTSAGWEDKNIKEALLLFKQGDFKKSTEAQLKVSEPVVTNENPPVEVAANSAPLTYFQQDGKEENLHVLAPEKIVEVIKKEEPVKIESELTLEQNLGPALENEHSVESIITADPRVFTEEHPAVVTPGQIVSQKIQTNKLITNTLTPAREPLSKQEPQSLIIHEEQNSSDIKMKEVELPANLPLIPFESSPHVWSFSRYKDVFHQEETKSSDLQEKVSVLQKVEETLPSEISVKPLQEKGIVVLDQEMVDEVDDMSLEKTPLTKGDQSLVVLASCMLLVIILILGYMYGNGRL